MKKIFIVFGCLFAVYSCRSQALYIVIDTRDTINIKYNISSYENIDYAKGEHRIEYFIRKDDPTEDYGGGILLRYSPYNDSVLKKWSLKKLRTVNISRKKWIKLEKQPTSKIVNGVNWIQKTPWDSIYKQMHQYYTQVDGIYIVDKKFSNKDSIQIRGVKCMYVGAQE